MPSVFVTGGSGFLGSRLLPALRRQGHSIVALDRSGSLRRQLQELPDVEVVIGRLEDPESYRRHLAHVDAVLHLAASTGRARSEEHFRTNGQGTELLLEQCRRAEIRKILFVSSIAATFPDVTGYPYAQSKMQAEDAVRRSGLPFAILRPTMILGQGSPILAALEKLALLPVIPVFGPGRTLVQPVYVDDVVEFVVRVLDRQMFSGQTFDVGGPDALTVEELLQSIRQLRKGTRGRVFHIPLALLLPPMRAAEAVGAGPLLPMSVGQLATFRFDGTAAANSIFDRREDLRDVPRMLSLSFDADTVRDQALERECAVFTKHLIGTPPDAYVARKYAEAHRLAAPRLQGDLFDAYLLRFAQAHWVLTKLADSYAASFSPRSLLRRKLVLLLAILETSPPSYRRIDAPLGGSKAVMLVRLILSGCGGLLAAVAGTLMLVPVRLIATRVGRKRR